MATSETCQFIAKFAWAVGETLRLLLCGDNGNLKQARLTLAGHRVAGSPDRPSDNDVVLSGLATVTAAHSDFHSRWLGPLCPCLGLPVSDSDLLVVTGMAESRSRSLMDRHGVGRRHAAESASGMLLVAL